MRGKFGSYWHDDNEIGLNSITKKEVRGQFGRRSHHQIDMVIVGVKQDATQSGLTAKLDALETAYATSGQDFILYLNDGATPSQHQLIDADTINGVRVIGGVNYLAGMPGVWGMRTEYVNRRTYQIHLRAEILAAESNYFVWHETIRQIGLGGPDIVAQDTLTGLPVLQTTNLFTPFMAEQFGMAVGVETWPTASTILWPGSLKPRQSFVSLETPQFVGTHDNLFFPMRWRYRYEAATSLFAVSPSIFW